MSTFLFVRCALWCTFLMNERENMEKKVLFAEKYMDGVKQAWNDHGYKVYEAKEEISGVSAEQTGQWLAYAEEEYGIRMVFSFNFFPTLAECSSKRGMKYVSWVWDCPNVLLWAKSARKLSNYIFVFDYVQYGQLLSRGMNNVYYLPLAADVDAFTEIIRRDADSSCEKYASDVTFLGNLYNDVEQILYDKIEYLPPYVNGYLDALMKVQRKIWGAYLLEEGVPDEVWRQLKQYVHWDLGDRYEEGTYEMMMKTMIGKKIAQLERKEVCSYLARHFDFVLYTSSDSSYDPMIHNKGYAEYLTQMPLIFHYSKINIHITIRPITSGVPLRVLDVLACGGFLLTNYQPEIAEYFVDGEELVIYSDFQDMYDKIQYYLEHEEERKRIAHAGYLKVKERFHYNRQVGEIVKVLEAAYAAESEEK